MSAKSSAALAAAERNLAAFLRRSDAPSADVAYTLEVGRASFRHRSAVVAGDREAAAAALEGGGSGRWSGVLGEDAAAPRLAFLFPGQGTQTVGMGRGLYEREKVFRGTVERCAEALAEPLGLDLRRLLYPPPEAEEEARRRLVDTRFAQPALFAVELALARLWMAWGLRPAAMLGHSIGEWVAACLAGVVSVDDALALVAERGRLMAEQPLGAMLAVPLGEAEVAALVNDRDLELAAFNEPSRVVVAGPEAAVEELEAELASRRVGARRLHTSHAFHSPMMEPAVAPFVAAVRRVTLKAPEIPFLSNLTGTWITTEEACDPDYWGRQLRRPVRFAAGVGELLAEPRRLLLEVGPGRTLTTLAGRHPARSGQPAVASLAGPRQQADDLATVLAARGRLWLAGCELDAAAFWAGEERRRLPLPTYPFVGRRYWIEPGAGLARPAASSEAAAPEKRDDVGEWFYLPSFKPSLPPRGGGDPPPEPWLIFLDPWGVGAALAERVRAAGRRAVTVKADLGWHRLGEDAYALRPGRGKDYDRLFAELLDRDAFPGAVVHAWSLIRHIGRITHVEAFESVQEPGFYSLLHLARALGRLGSGPVDLTVVGDRLLAVTGAETPQPEKATLLGLLRVLPQELPHLTCRVIDVELDEASDGELDGPAARLAARLADEIAARSPEAVIAWRGGGRFIESLEPVRLERRRPERPADDLRPFRRRGVYLLTGSLDGDTLALAGLLARVAGARLAVVEPAGVVDPATADRAPADRETADPAPADRQRQLEELGAEVLLLSADLGDPAAVAAAVAAAEDRFGALDGVIHTAGAAGEQNFRALGETGSAECAWHFVPKIHGLYALDQALAGRRLEVRLLLSSLASLLGGLAYGAYAAANAFLDAWAAAGAGGDGGWRSIGWEVWQSAAEGDGITIVRRDLAALAMTRDEGEEAFLRAAAAGTPRILVSTADLAARAAHARSRLETLRDRRPPGAAREAHPRPELDTPYAPPESDLERRLVELWGGVLGFEGIGVDDNFFELGGDSLLAIEVVERLRQGEGVDLPVARLYQGLTVRALVRVLARSGEAGEEERRSELAERRQAMDRRRQFQRSRRTRGES